MGRHRTFPFPAAGPERTDIDANQNNEYRKTK